MGNGAKIFLVSLLVSLCVFGLVSFVIVSSVKDNAKKVSYDGNGENTALDASIEGESFSVLSILTEKDSSLISAVLLRYDRERAEITFTPICPKTTLNDTDLESMYTKGGALELINGVYLLTGIRAQYYAISNSEELVKAIDLIGKVRYTFSESVSAGGISFEEGSTFLTGNMALALLRYGSTQTYREEYAANILRSICERLSGDDGEDAYAKICTCVATTLTKSDFAAKKELVAAYGQMTKKTVRLCGTYRGDGQSRYFVSDTEATLDLFSKYRKIYN